MWILAGPQVSPVSMLASSRLCLKAEVPGHYTLMDFRVLAIHPAHSGGATNLFEGSINISPKARSGQVGASIIHESVPALLEAVLT